MPQKIDERDRLQVHWRPAVKGYELPPGLPRRRKGQAAVVARHRERGTKRLEEQIGCEKRSIRHSEYENRCLEGMQRSRRGRWAGVHDDGVARG
jgi:hypothetical protein